MATKKELLTAIAQNFLDLANLEDSNGNPPDKDPPEDEVGILRLDESRDHYIETIPRGRSGYAISFRIEELALDTRDPSGIHKLALIMPKNGWPFSAVGLLLNNRNVLYAVTGNGVAGQSVSRIRTNEGTRQVRVSVEDLIGSVVTISCDTLHAFATVVKDGTSLFRATTGLDNGVHNALRNHDVLCWIGHPRSTVPGELDVPWSRLVASHVVIA